MTKQPGTIMRLLSKVTLGLAMGLALPSGGNATASTDQMPSGRAAPDHTGEISRILAIQAMADAGDASAQYTLGVMYERGQGVSKDETQAVSWYQRAAAQGLATAQYNLATMYSLGHGTVRNDIAAVSWYRKAADQGIAAAQNNLGTMY